MKHPPAMKRLWIILISLAMAGGAFAQSLDMGVPELRALDPTLTGSGVSVIQAEPEFTGTNDWEVDPGSLGLSQSEFTYISVNGTATTFPNSLGIGSEHAHYVADNFYGDYNTADPEGIAYGISHVYNYEANYFANNIISSNSSALPAEIVNQSFNFVVSSSTEQMEDDEVYDNYAAKYGTLFITGAGDGGEVGSPASAYNGIAVGAYEGASSSGNYDGRSKPDIVAYAPGYMGGDETSYTAPIVSGAAAILLQAAARGDAGTAAQTIADAEDARVLKALLLNGAIKPTDWKSTVANPQTTPLDPVTGAGVLSVYNSYLNLAAGRHMNSSTQSGTVGPVATGTIDPNEGWDLETMTNSFSFPQNAYLSRVNSYRFDLTAATSPEFTLTATLIWWREENQTGINNFFLYLYNTDTNQLITASLSTIDNTQVIYAQDLAQGNYDLAVVKSGSNLVSMSDTYALAFDFASVPEPAAEWLMVPGLGLFFLVRRRLSCIGQKHT